MENSKQPNGRKGMQEHTGRASGTGAPNSPPVTRGVFVSLPKEVDQQVLARDLEQLARWMDSVFRIPGVGLRFGLDALLGLLPGAGDVAASAVSLYIFMTANKYGVSRVTIARMALNIAIDLVMGAIPFVGDLFDIYWKSNQRNVDLLRRHVEANPNTARKLRISDHLFVGALAIGLCTLIVASAVTTVLAVKWLFTGLNRIAG